MCDIRYVTKVFYAYRLSNMPQIAAAAQKQLGSASRVHKAVSSIGRNIAKLELLSQCYSTRGTQTLPLTDLSTAMAEWAAPAGSTALQADWHQPSSQLHMAETHTPLILLPASCAEQMREIYMQQKVPQGNSEFELCYTLRNSCKMGTKFNRLITNLLSHEGWLGVLVSLLDGVASTHVFGTKGTPGRPRGCITLTRLDSMADDKQLDEAQHLRWMQFLQVWQNAGWYDIAVITTAEELRSLQYGHFDKLCQHMDIITSHQMLAVIAKYANSRGQRRFCIKDYLISFLNVVQQFFSRPSKVLLEAPDVYQRLHKVQVMCA